MSYSNDFDDKKQISSLPGFTHAVQILGPDTALRLEISRLRDAETRRACEAQLTYALEHSRLADRRYARAEDAYVQKHLKPGLFFMPVPKWISQSHETRADELRAEFRASPEGQEAFKAREERKAALWDRAIERVEAAQQAQTAGRQAEDNKHPQPARGLSRRFQRSVDR